MNLLPRAGDIVVMSECLSHAVLPWRPTEKPRLCLQMRYKCGTVLAEAEPIQYGVDGPYPHWPEEVLASVAPVRLTSTCSLATHFRIQT